MRIVLTSFIRECQGLRHGPATYFHPNGNKEEATYVEGYEEGESTVYYARSQLEYVKTLF